MPACPICGPKLSICCVIMNIWGIIMLAILGVFFKIGSPGLFEDISVDHAEWKNRSYSADYVMEKYETTAINCWLAAGIYVVILIFSIIQQRMNSRNNYEMS